MWSKKKALLIIPSTNKDGVKRKPYLLFHEPTKNVSKKEAMLVSRWNKKVALLFIPTKNVFDLIKRTVLIISWSKKVDYLFTPNNS